MTITKINYFIITDRREPRAVKFKIDAKSDTAAVLMGAVFRRQGVYAFKKLVVEKHTITMGKKIGVVTEIIYPAKLRLVKG